MRFLLPPVLARLESVVRTDRWRCDYGLRGPANDNGRWWLAPLGRRP
jgi:hypothetical protein